MQLQDKNTSNIIPLPDHCSASAAQHRLPALSPAMRVPTEILQKIFSYAQAVITSPNCDVWYPDSKRWTGNRFEFFDELSWHRLPEPHHNDGTTPGFGDPDQCPWSISLVCQKWRDVALDMPKLWSYIELCLNSNSRIAIAGCTIYGFQGSILRLLDLTLARSKSCGLNLVFHWLLPDSGSYRQPSVYLPYRIIEPLSRHLNRWERVYSAGVRIDWDMVRTAFVDKSGKRHIYAHLVTLAFPRLEAIAAHRFEDVFPKGLPCSTPSLKVLSGLSKYSPFGQEENAGGWSSVRNYSDLYNFKKGRARADFVPTLRVLGRMQHLTNLRLSIDDDPYGRWSAFSGTTMCITLASLTSLSIGTRFTHTVKDVLLHLRTPSLQHLHMLCLDDAKLLTSLLESSSCSLLSLKINEAGLDNEDVCSILRRTPEMTDLYLSFLQISRPVAYRDRTNIGILDDTLLECLLHPIEGICPRLSSLTLLKTRGLNMGLMMDILKMRFPGPQSKLKTQLRKIELGIAHYDEAAFVHEYKDLLRDLETQHGLCVQLKPWELRYDSDSSLGDTSSESASFTDSDPETTSEESFSGDEMEEEDENNETQVAVGVPFWSLYFCDDDDNSSEEYQPSLHA